MAATRYTYPASLWSTCPLDIPTPWKYLPPPLNISPEGIWDQAYPPPPPNRMTDIVENITFLQLRWRTIKMCVKQKVIVEWLPIYGQVKTPTHPLYRSLLSSYTLWIKPFSETNWLLKSKIVYIWKVTSRTPHFHRKPRKYSGFRFNTILFWSIRSGLIKELKSKPVKAFTNFHFTYSQKWYNFICWILPNLIVLVVVIIINDRKRS